MDMSPESLAAWIMKDLSPDLQQAIAKADSEKIEFLVKRDLKRGVAAEWVSTKLVVANAIVKETHRRHKARRKAGY